MGRYCRIVALRTNKECSFKQKVKNVVAEIWKKTIAPDIKTLIDEYNCIAKSTIMIIQIMLEKYRYTGEKRLGTKRKSLMGTH